MTKATSSSAESRVATRGDHTDGSLTSAPVYATNAPAIASPRPSFHPQCIRSNASCPPISGQAVNTATIATRNSSAYASRHNPVLIAKVFSFYAAEAPPLTYDSFRLSQSNTPSRAATVRERSKLRSLPRCHSLFHPAPPEAVPTPDF